MHSIQREWYVEGKMMLMTMVMEKRRDRNPCKDRKKKEKVTNVQERAHTPTEVIHSTAIQRWRRSKRENKRTMYIAQSIPAAE